MDADVARALANRLHARDREPDGAPILLHVRRVVLSTPPEARSVAWLHEVLALTAVSEEELLMAGLTSDQLRALRLLHRTDQSASAQAYLAHLELIADAAGSSGHLARTVKVADLQDRLVHPRVRPGGWTPPYAMALRLVTRTTREATGAAVQLKLPGRRDPARPLLDVT